MSSTLSNIAMPAGMVFPFAGTAIPDGFLLCDGTAVSRAAYAKLFAAIGTAYGVGNGSTTFNLPDLVGYFIKGGTPDGVKNADTTKPNGLTVASTTPGATGSTTPGATGGPSTASSESTTPGATGGPSTASSEGVSADHTHSIASSGAHNHSGYYVGGVALTGGGAYSLFCANNTGATFQITTTTGNHTHSTGGASAGHTHGLNSHTHTSAAHTHGLNSHTHTSAAHTHGLNSHTHTSAAHTHTSAAHAHTLTGDTETAPKNVKMNYIIKT